MGVTVKFACDGCFEESGPHTLPHRQFHSVTGRSYGFGKWSKPSVEDIIPNGWIYPDPYTGCTYCPKCWAEIKSEAGVG